MGQALGSESMEFLHQLISGKALRLSPIGKESMGYLPIDQYKRMLCMAFLTEEMRVGEVRYYLNGKCGSGMAKKARPVTRNIELEMIINGWAWVTEQYAFDREEIGRAHVCTPVTNAHIVCRLLLEKKKQYT